MMSMIDEIEESTIDELAETELFKELETLDNFELNEYEVKRKDIVAYVEELNDIFQKNNNLFLAYVCWDEEKANIFLKALIKKGIVSIKLVHQIFNISDNIINQSRFKSYLKKFLVENNLNVKYFADDNNEKFLKIRGLDELDDFDEIEQIIIEKKEERFPRSILIIRRTKPFVEKMKPLRGTGIINDKE